MRINVKTAQELHSYVEKIDSHIKNNHDLKWTKYVTLGKKTVRLQGYASEFLKYVERQLTYVLKDNSESFDATIVLWKEDTAGMQQINDSLLSTVHPHRLRLESLMLRGKPLNTMVFNEKTSALYPAIRVELEGGFVNVYEPLNDTYYYGVRDLSPEEFIKEGHMLVQYFNKISKTENTALVHGALVGLENQGVLFCARGQRGKSTLSVLSMMDGFDYVSDDYLLLEKSGDKLVTDPIYSIITLSPRMYDELYDKLEGSRFLSNNARKDKYVVNIANYHNQFKSNYPVKFCMFPEIVSDAEPSIVPCPKGRAITQLVQSTVCQLQDLNSHEVIKKIKDMVKNQEFYQINLCQDIQKNTDCLRYFIKNYENRTQKTFVEDRMYEDMVFNVTHILDSETNIIYFLNEFATIVYKNLKNGVDEKEILSKLKSIKEMPLSIENNFNSLVNALLDKKILKELKTDKKDVDIDLDLIKESNYSLVFDEYLENKTINLVK